jgi:hypothetical protein
VASGGKKARNSSIVSGPTIITTPVLSTQTDYLKSKHAECRKLTFLDPKIVEDDLEAIESE